MILLLLDVKVEGVRVEGASVLLLLLRCDCAITNRTEREADCWIQDSRSCLWTTRPKLWTVSRDIMAPEEVVNQSVS